MCRSISPTGSPRHREVIKTSAACFAYQTSDVICSFVKRMKRMYSEPNTSATLYREIPK